MRNLRLDIKDKEFFGDASDVDYAGETAIIIVNTKTNEHRDFFHVENEMCGTIDNECVAYKFETEDKEYKLTLFND